MEILPKDPVMLMSFVNMKLRDEYRTLEDFCSSYGLDENKLKAMMECAGFEWLPDIRQFR
ncbi:MAG: DUF4250 domain-containing protein [Muribaculaceae bacterium]|nr:DUF4250 domain-containing protein [Muribaculaceae bacterium]MDE7096206.1 DUF4250 domain-containing protein [Muribaculaceae bacterium]